MAKGYSPMEGGGIQRTEMNCHNCNKNFVAELDLDISGDYTIECAHCGHEHYRRIDKGEITEARWQNGQDNTPKLSPRSVWKSSVIKAQTSTVAHFLRDRWLNRSDVHAAI